MGKKIFSITLFIFLATQASSVLADSLTIQNPLGFSDFKSLLSNIAGWIGGLIAALGTIFIIWAGILYLTSAGSQATLEKAKKAFIYAVVGIIVGVLAKPIVDIISGIFG
jgi:hypothetical protein